MAQLIIISSADGEMENKCFPLIGKNTIGRSPSNTIVFSSGNISPYHVSIETINGEIWLENISKNKEVFVNEFKQEKTKLSHGDIITLGSYIILFDDQQTVEQSKNIVDGAVQSRIESRQKQYNSTQHVLQSLGDIDKSHGRLITLYKVSNAISGILDLDQVLQRFLDIILDEFPADRAFILLFDEMGKNLSPVAVYTNKGEMNPNSKISQTIVNEVLTTKESILSENVMNDKRFFDQDSLADQNVTSAICVPLLRSDNVLGLIYLDSGRENLFVASDLDLLTKIALQASVVIENARLYKEHQKFNENLIALSHVTQNLSSSLEEKSIGIYAAQCASQILNCTKSFLILQKEDSYYISYSVGIDEKLHDQIALPTSLQNVFTENKTILAKQKEEIPQDILWMIEKEYIDDSLICVPIVSSLQERNVEKTTMGIIVVSHKKNDSIFKPSDLQILTILAGYTAIALTNARLYQDLQRKEEEIASWNQELEKRVQERTEQIQSMQDQLVQSEKMAAVGLLAAGVSHEFNNIIASMYGFSQIAKKNDKYKDKLVDIVIEQSQRACEITESLLSFSKQRGDIEEFIEVQEIIDDVLKLTKPALEKEGIKVIKEFKSSAKTYTIPDKLEQVFLHVIINSRDAIEEEGVVTINTWDENERICVSIRDNGKGIHAQNLTKVFDPFYTTKGSFGGGSQPGTGVGLSICYNIIKSLNGDIYLDSKLGEGTTVTIALPIYKEKGKYSTTRRVKTFIGQRVIVLEKKNDIRELLCSSLEEKGFEVISYDDQISLEELCDNNDIDMLFLDIKVCENFKGNNTDIISHIKDNFSKAKIIFLVGRAEDANVIEYVKKSDGYLRKPFDINDVYRIINQSKGIQL